MTDFILKQLPYDLSNQAGLALISKYLKRINFNGLVDPAFSVRSGIANSDILKNYLGLLCISKNDFDAIEGQLKDAFFARALGLRPVPSSPTLRQRMDTHSKDWFDLTERINAAVLGLKIGGKSALTSACCPVAMCHWMWTPSSWTTAPRPRSMWGVPTRGRWLLSTGRLSGHPGVLSGAGPAPGHPALGQ